MKRKTLRNLILILLAALIVYALLPRPTSLHIVDPAIYERIAVRMDIQDALNLMKLPPGDYTSGPIVLILDYKEHQCTGQEAIAMCPEPGVRVWVFDNMMIVIQSDASGKVMLKAAGEVVEPFSKKLRRWLLFG